MALSASFGCQSAGPVFHADYAALPCIVPLDFVPDAAEGAVAPKDSSMNGPHSVEECIGHALTQNPRIYAARKAIEAKAYRVPQAASLEDPMVSAMGYPFTNLSPQFVNGRMTAGVGVSQKVPWMGKLESQAAAAEAETNEARARLASVELELVERVRKTYFELQYAEEAVKITERDRGLLVDLAKLAEARYKTNAASQQDILRAQLEVENLDGDLIRMRQERDSTRAMLAKLLHLSPDTAIETTPGKPIENLPSDLDRLYRDAVSLRPELHAQLAMIDHNEWMVEAARLNYYPDITYNVTWEAMTTQSAMSAQADGIDMLQVGLMFNIPIYRERLDAAVREAESQVVASAREYDAMKDETLEEVKSSFLQAKTHQELGRLFRDNIVPKAEQTLQLSLRAYQVGQTDILQLVDNWRQLLKVRLAQSRAESQLRQSLASLERLVGRDIGSESHAEPIPTPSPTPQEDPAPPLPEDPSM